MVKVWQAAVIAAASLALWAAVVGALASFAINAGR